MFSPDEVVSAGAHSLDEFEPELRRVCRLPLLLSCSSRMMDYLGVMLSGMGVDLP